MSHNKTQGKSFAGGENSICRGPEAGSTVFISVPQMLGTWWVFSNEWRKDETGCAGSSLLFKINYGVHQRNHRYRLISKEDVGMVAKGLVDSFVVWIIGWLTGSLIG